MTRLRPRLLGLPLAVLAVACLSAIAAGGSGARAAAPSGAREASTLNWQSCQPRGYQCATLTVPLDYSDASKGTIKLALTRLPALDSSQRIGSLLSDPGGPGDSAIDFLHDWAPTLAPTIRDHFDLVAFDPRGVGQSTPIVCHNTLQAFTAVDPSPHDQAGWEAADAAAKTFADQCATKYGDYLNYVGTKNVARDMESVRVALGEDKLTYLGYSYGTTIGAVYADMYPDKVRAFVLDGATDLSQTFQQINGTQMVGFERGFSAYVADCQAKRCFGSQDPQKVIEGLIAQSEKKPLPAPEADRPAGPGEVLLGVIFAQYSQSLWPELTQAATLALQGDGSGFVELSDAYLQRNQDGSYPNISEANAAVNFVDETCPHDLAAYEQMATQFEKMAPHFGEAAATSGLLCAHWQAKPDPLTTPRAAGAAPIVVIATTDDPATPYEWGVAMSKQLESGHLITHRGYGHTVYDTGDSCIDNAVNDYLINLTVPKQGLTCGTGPPPPESGDSTAPTAAPGGSATPAAGSATSPAGPKSTATQKAPLPPSTGTSSSSKGGGGQIAVIAAVFVVLALVVAGTVVFIERRN